MRSAAPNAAAHTTAPPVIAGIARLVKHAYAGGDLGPLWHKLVEHFSANGRDAWAMMDMSVVLQIGGHRDKGLQMQRNAVRLQHCFSQIIGSGEGLRIL